MCITKLKKPIEKEIKTMNEKTRNCIEEMKKQTIGIEIEMANITREKACRVIAKYFGTEHTVNHDGGGYDAGGYDDGGYDGGDDGGGDD